MKKQTNKYIAVSYKLYTTENGEKKMVEETSEKHPFVFLSGFGTTLEAFEKAVINMEKDNDFDFTLTQEEAYGEHLAERVLDLDKEMFTINGHFDHDNIYVDAIVPLQNEDGNRFFGHVLSISDDKVKMDLNHPLAGKDLNFIGKILESRDATNEEIESFINHLDGSECGCDDCDGNCDAKHKENGCGCGHCH